LKVGARGRRRANPEPTRIGGTKEDSMREATTMRDIWNYRDRSELGSNVTDTHADLSGFGVEALDGSIGKIDDATYQVGRSFVVVDTGPWIFGKKVLLPAGVIRGIDETEELVFVNRTKEQIKNAPEFDDSLVDDERYLDDIGAYYSPGGSGYRENDEML
jgi:hypothetical protein